MSLTPGDIVKFNGGPPRVSGDEPEGRVPAIDGLGSAPRKRG